MALAAHEGRLCTKRDHERESPDEKIWSFALVDRVSLSAPLIHLFYRVRNPSKT